MSDTKPLVVIGAGPGGYAAAFLAADLGVSVTLIDPDPNPGGVCLYRGCIPSKALLHVAKVIHEAHDAKDWGVTFAAPKIDPKKVTSWKDDVVAATTGGLGQLVKSRKIEYIQGKARFIDAHTLEEKRVSG
ncbi:MAG: FAD-dependent oxidoreductase, partial [bacterium]|nr:FAD-dependent oxidoreductase [bacterium]